MDWRGRPDFAGPIVIGRDLAGGAPACRGFWVRSGPGCSGPAFSGRYWHTYVDWYTYGHTDTDRYPNPDLDANRHAYDHANTDPHPDSITDQHTYQHAAVYQDANRHPDPDCRPHAIMA